MIIYRKLLGNFHFLLYSSNCLNNNKDVFKKNKKILLFGQNDILYPFFFFLRRKVQDGL